MKTLLAAIAVAAVVLAGGADAATAPSSAGTNTVTVSGTGSVTAVPDQASFDFTVTTKAATASAALAKNGTDARAVIAAVKGAGVDAADIQTAQVSLDPVMSSDGTSDRRLHGLRHDLRHEALDREGGRHRRRGRRRRRDERLRPVPHAVLAGRALQRGAQGRRRPGEDEGAGARGRGRRDPRRRS